MSSLLILLVLLSLATLASRRGGFAALLASSLPAFTVGIAAGPAGFGYLSASSLHSLAPAAATGICWLGLVLGHRASRRHGLAPRSIARAVFVVVVTACLIAAIVTAADHWWSVSSSLAVRGGIGLLGATILLPFSGNPAGADDNDSRALDLVVVASVVVAVLLLVGRGPFVATLGTLVAGALAGVSALLVGGNDDARRFPALLAAAALITGLAWALDVHVGIAGVGIGVGVSLLDRHRQIDALLDPTAGPVALVVAFLVGALLPLVGVGIGVGVAFSIVAMIVIAGSSNATTDDDGTIVDGAVVRAATSATGLLILGGLLLERDARAALGDIAGSALGIALGVLDAVVVVVVLVLKGASARRSRP
ncbi:MAG TPA: hypothetical protein VGF99_06075 [Myxococcota bacterium]